MRLVGDSFPLLVYVAPKEYSAVTVRQLAEAFEPYFARGERYAFLSVQPKSSIPPGPAERKLLMEWVQSPRTREYASQLCVGSAAVTHSALMRGALTAILWFWKLPFPLEPVPSIEAGVEYCVNRLVEAAVPLPIGRASLCRKATASIEAALRDWK